MDWFTNKLSARMPATRGTVTDICFLSEPELLEYYFLDPDVKRIERIEILALRVFDISTFLYNVNDDNYYDILDTRSYHLVRVYSYTSYIFYIYT